MAKSDITVDVHRGNYGRVWTITVLADPDEAAQVREAVRADLEARGWDKDLWREFCLRWWKGWSMAEVRAD